MVPLDSITIVGGGTAGWMSAACLARVFQGKSYDIRLVESPDIPTVGVGEATIPPIIDFIRFLGIDEVDFIKKTNATFKLAIKFDNWRTIGDSYWHQFGSVGFTLDSNPFYQVWLKSVLAGKAGKFTDYSPAIALASQNKFIPAAMVPKNSILETSAYAWHFDAALVAKYLRDYSIKLGVKRYEDTVDGINQNASTGDIESLVLKSGNVLASDFFIDCSGFKKLLISETLGVKFIDWSKYLPCNSAVAAPSEASGHLRPYTLASAQEAGWIWNIPLQHREGNGYVYSNHFCTDDQAANIFRAKTHKLLAEPRIIRFTAGCTETVWEKNCIAIGLASGFLEPLESTSIHLIMRGIRKFIELLPDKTNHPVARLEYNRIMKLEYECIRDFIILHYCETQREDTEFWRYCKNMEIPESLQYKIDLFRYQGRLAPSAYDLFKDLSWYAVFEGMGVRPTSYDPLVDLTSFDDLLAAVDDIGTKMAKAASMAPSHAEFIAKHCANELFVG